MAVKLSFIISAGDSFLLFSWPFRLFFLLRFFVGFFLVLIFLLIGLVILFIRDFFYDFIEVLLKTKPSAKIEISVRGFCHFYSYGQYQKKNDKGRNDKITILLF